LGVRRIVVAALTELIVRPSVVFAVTIAQTVSEGNWNFCLRGCAVPNRLLLVVTLLISVSSLPAEDWPTYLNGNQRHGYTAEKIQLPLQTSWQFVSVAPPEKSWGVGPGDRIIEGKDLEHRVTHDDAFHVAVVGDRAYFGSSVDHQVRCVDAASGKEQWHFFTGGPVRLAPTVHNGHVYFGSDDGFVYCLSADDGKSVWKLRAGPVDEWLIARGEMISRWPIRTNVMINDDIAYFGAGLFPHENVYLYAVDTASGKIIWKHGNISQRDAGRNDLSPQGYLLCSDDKLFVPSGRSMPGVYKLDNGMPAYKGTVNWRKDGISGGTQALLSDGQLYTYGAHQILAMDEKNGAVGFGWFNGDQMAIDGDSAYISNGSILGRLSRKEYAVNSRERHKLELELADNKKKVNAAKGEEKTKLQNRNMEIVKRLGDIENVGFVWKIDSPHESSLIVAGDHVISGGQGELVVFNKADGSVAWKQSMDGAVRGLAVANGRLYASTDSGHVACFSEDGANAAITQQIDESPYPNDKSSATIAKQILTASGDNEGFCLVVGSERGQLAWQIARQSKMRVYCVEPDLAKVEESRELFAKAGLYGNRVIVHHAELNELPYSSYFANIIVSETQLRTGRLPMAADRIARHIKPLGGKLFLGITKAGSTANKKATEFAAALGLGEGATTQTTDSWIVVTRKGLDGAGNWSHQYGDAGNTACSKDYRVKGGLGVLWYGDPGENKMVNRHEGAVGPLATNGRMFIQGDATIMAYDAYNGRFLWEIDNPDSIRTGVFQNNNPGNLVASDDALFYMTGDVCVQLDAATGQVIRKLPLPKGKADGKHQWGYVAYHDGLLFGTATHRGELESRLRRRGRKTQDSTDAIFAIDVATGKHKWLYQGKNIAHHTIAIGGERVFLIDSSITSEERNHILQEDKTELTKLSGKARERAEELAKKADLRRAVALNAKTGEQEWAKPVDVTDCSEIGIGGGKLTLIYANDVLVLCGANANGHYWKQFIAGDFSKRRLVALSAENGKRLWAKDANYRHRPIVVDDQIVAEPWSYDLYSGVQKSRSNPVTGKDEPWSMMRSGHHCGMMTATPNMLFFRAGFTGIYDLEQDDGTQHFAGHRTGCWINMIPANGLLMIPESSAGCVCLFSVASTIVMEPREARRPWALYSSTGKLTPVKHLSLNFGAPGDRKDARGRVWLSYPRPKPSKVTSLDLNLGAKHELYKNGKFLAADSHTTPINGAEVDWVSSSTAGGLKQFTVPCIGQDEEPATYSLRLHFTELDETVKPGERVFDVFVQGKKVLADIDIVKKSQATNTAIVETVDMVQVTDNLIVTLAPKDPNVRPSRAPVLNGLEVIRQD
jgi:outer membrane protein assembly factor BamB